MSSLLCFHGVQYDMVHHARYNGKPKRTRKALTRKSHHGFSGLLAFAILMMTGLILSADSLSQMNMSNARRSIVSEQDLQLYYVAQGGIQEALGTRMVPRSNWYNLVINPAVPAYLRTSGRVYENPDFTNPTGLVGLYRYMVLGGDPAVDPVTGVYDPAQSNRLQSILPEQPFYVVSKGSICRNAVSRAVVSNSLVLNTDGQPACSVAGTVLDEMVLMSSVDMSRPDTRPNTDLVNNYQQFRRQGSQPDITVNLPAPVYVSPVGVTRQFEFEQAWRASKTGNGIGDAKPVQVAFHNVAETGGTAPLDPSKVLDLQQGGTPNLSQIDAGSVIRLIFQGGVDHRSLFMDQKQAGNRALSQCVNQPATCNVQIRQKSNQRLYQGSTMFPLYPSSNQLLIYPPKEQSNRLINGTTYQIVLNGTINDWRGNEFNPASNVLAEFTTSGNPPSPPPPPPPPGPSPPPGPPTPPPPPGPPPWEPPYNY
jgi:hypothetical protein